MAGLALAREVGTDRFHAPDAPRSASFAERGVAVAFTTPTLASSRLRIAARGGLEVVMPNPVGGRGVYIIPWSALAEIMTPTVHDRVLHQVIAGGGALDPERVRLAQLNVAARGFAGTDAAAAAAHALADDDRAAVAVNLALMVQLIHDGGVTSGAALQAAEDGRAGREYKRALASIAARVEIDALGLADRIEALSACLAPLGLPEPRPAGRLRRVVMRLAELRSELADWGRAVGGDHGDVAVLCGEAAADTLERCVRIIEAGDRRLDALIPSLRAWPREARFLDEARLRLAWLLDGWRRAIVTWAAVREAPRPDQTLALGSIFRALPLLPGEEDPQATGLELAHMHRRLMRRCRRSFDEAEAAPATAEAVRRMELVNLHAELV